KVGFDGDGYVTPGGSWTGLRTPVANTDGVLRNCHRGKQQRRSDEGLNGSFHPIFLSGIQGLPKLIFVLLKATTFVRGHTPQTRLTSGLPRIPCGRNRSTRITARNANEALNSRLRYMPTSNSS